MNATTTIIDWTEDYTPGQFSAHHDGCYITIGQRDSGDWWAEIEGQTYSWRLQQWVWSQIGTRTMPTRPEIEAEALAAIDALGGKRKDAR